MEVKKVKKDGTLSKQGEGGGNHVGTQGRKPSIDKFASEELKALIAKKWVAMAQELAIPYLESVFKDKTANHDIKKRAADTILDRAFGKAKESMDITSGGEKVSIQGFIYQPSNELINDHVQQSDERAGKES
jgi:hypothetical protein